MSKNTSSRKIERIIVHHSEGKNDTFQRIKRWHTTKDDPKTANKEGMGWSNVAYHFIIEKDGKIFKGRSETVSSGGTRNSSANSLEVCLCGDFDSQTPQPAALNRLRLLLCNWCKTYSIQPNHKTIVGHKDVQAKKGDKINRCPGNTLHNSLPLLRTQVSALLVDKK